MCGSQVTDLLNGLASDDPERRRKAVAGVIERYEKRLLRFLSAHLHKRLGISTSPESVAQSVWLSFFESAEAHQIDETSAEHLLATLFRRCVRHMVDSNRFFTAHKRGGGEVANESSASPEDGAENFGRLLEACRPVKDVVPLSKTQEYRDSGSSTAWTAEEIDAVSELLDHTDPSAKLVVDDFLKILDDEQRTVLIGMLEGRSDKTIATRLHKSESAIVRRRKQLQRRANESFDADAHGYG